MAMAWPRQVFCFRQERTKKGELRPLEKCCCGCRCGCVAVLWLCGCGCAVAVVLWDSLLRGQGRGQEGEVGSKACVLSAKVATTCVSRRRGERGWHVGRIFTVLGDMHERRLRRRSIKGFRAQPPGKPVRMRIYIYIYIILYII